MKIFNSKGELIVLNQREQLLADKLQRECNSLGYEANITTLTTISKKVSEQKFFELAPADYLPIRVGEGAWSTQLTTFRSFNLSDDFATGILNTGANNARLAQGDTGVDSVSVKVNNWAKGIGWSIFDLEYATKSGNWDLVTAKSKARKKNWDLGIQKVAFLGLTGDTSVLGLLTQSGITPNTSVITQSLSSMTGTQLKTFCSTILDTYRTNCGRSAWPSHFTIPESDYLGLAAPSSPDFPLKSVLQVLLETFQTMTKNKNFQILPCAYGDQAYSGLGVQRYALYNAEEESIRMDIPVDFTSTLANSIDNFSFQNAAYGQFSGVMAYRPLELMYFQF
jgi:hypothetical protein